MADLPRTSRRRFLQTSSAFAAAIGLPTIVPSSVLGRDGQTAPSNRITMGFIGTGGKGRHNIGELQRFNDCQVVAVCDVDAAHMNAARDQVNQKYGNNDCQSMPDFRELVGRSDIDAVCVSTPDHWHAISSMAALNAGKDVYCEKPLTNSVAEGRAVCRAAALNGRILQTGSHERSSDLRRYVCELVRNGRIGKLHTIRINLPNTDPHHMQIKGWTDPQPDMPIPENLNWDMWLGHCAPVPYTEKRCHFYWRFILAHGGGEMTDRGAHIIDLAQLGADRDDTGPVEFIAKGSRNSGGIFDAFMDYVFINIYADGLKLIGSTQEPRGLKFEGDEGWIFMHVHDQKATASHPSLLTSEIGDDEIHLGRSPDGHHRNFLDCVKLRTAPMAPAEVGHRTGSICHLNNIAMKLGRAIKWDPVNEVIVGDAEANQLLSPIMRAPWSI